MSCLSLRVLVALLWQYSVGAAREGSVTCDSQHLETSDDAISALQTGLRDVAVKLQTDKEPEWQDAVEYEREFFSHSAASSLQVEPQPTDDVFVENVQAAPKSEPPTGPIVAKPYDPPSEKMRFPEEIRSENGVLKTTLTVEAGWAGAKGTGVRIMTRLYNGQYPGPTIRVKRGDFVEIKVVNKLEPDFGSAKKWQRREGQQTNAYPEGVPKDSIHYMDVGQTHEAPNKMIGVPNNMHQINATNLHVHGWHVSPVGDQDNVFSTKISPGEEHTYRYQLYAAHNSGNSWYHPHLHGSVTAQVGGGMVGALLIDDDGDGEVPDWIASSRDVVAVIQDLDWGYFGPDYEKWFPNDPNKGCFPFNSQDTDFCARAHRLALMANLSGDALFRIEYQKGFGYGKDEKEPMPSLILTNGQYRPTLDFNTGEWIRVRVILASGNVMVNLILDSEGAKVCDMLLVAKDNAWLSEIPRKITKGAFLGAGNRAQLMIRCSQPGMFALQNNMTEYANTLMDPKQKIIIFKVAGDAVKVTSPPTTQPSVPRYLQDLYNLPEKELATPITEPARNQYNNMPLVTFLPNGTDPNGSIVFGKTIQQYMGADVAALWNPPSSYPSGAAGYSHNPIRFTINSLMFNAEKPQATIGVGEVVELNITGVATHSWHMHTNPVQYVSFMNAAGSPIDPEEVYGGYFRTGDWSDTLQLPDTSSVVVRFQTDCYTGPQIIHCHVLYHEDLGMFTWFNATGTDHTIDSRFEMDGIFKNPPKHCTQEGAQCAKPWCTDYKYGQQQQQQQVQHMKHPYR